MFKNIINNSTKSAMKRRNAKSFLVVSFDLQKSKNKTALYPRVYSALKAEVGEENYFRTLKQYCVIKTDIFEESIAQFVRSICGDGCNISVFKLTGSPLFDADDKSYAADMERLKAAMEEDDML